MKKAFEIIREAKIEAAKSIFRSFGPKIEKMADVLTEDELLMAFEWFLFYAKADDDERDNEVLLMEYSEMCVRNNLISAETRLKVKPLIRSDFFESGE